MKIRLLIIFVFLSTSLGKVFPYNYDNLFIENLKSYVFKEFNLTLEGEFYTTWAKDNEPEIVFFISLSGKIQVPPDLFYSYSNSDVQDVLKVRIIETEYRKKGYSTFIYKTYATGKTYLNERFVSYPCEEITFIAFHELLHHYFFQQKIYIPYEFVEAACDVVGNYGTLNYSMSGMTDKVRISKVQKQTLLNESIYKLFNFYIDSINQSRKQEEVKYLCGRCNISLHKLLTDADDFQKDRFDYTVNNAFLLKNSNYCVEYFLLKRVLFKAGSIKNFLEIIKGIPHEIPWGEKYLEKYLEEYLEEYLNQFILSYNPRSADGTIMLPEKDNGMFTFRLFSGTGKLVKQETFNNGNHQFDCNGLSDGLYLYYLTGNKRNYSGKLQIKIE
jgi:hypothetical protein